MTSAIRPPWAPRTTATRCSVCLPAAAGRCSSRSHTCRNRANPAASRVRAMPRTSAPPRGTAATNQAVLGRRTSAQIATVNAAPNGPVRPAGRPAARSHWAGIARQSAPAVSAPLASQRSCQLAPGCSPSQSSSAPSPRRRCFCAPTESSDERCAGQPVEHLLPGLVRGWPACSRGAAGTECSTRAGPHRRRHAGRAIPHRRCPARHR